jgi:hypothetical protein
MKMRASGNGLRSGWLPLAVFFLGTSVALGAQNSQVSQDSQANQGYAGQQDTASASRTARLSFTSGNVSVDIDGQSAPAQINMPLVQGQRVATGDDGQAEIEFEDGSFVRLTPNSSVALSSMQIDGANHASTAVDLLGGLLYLETRVSDSASYFFNAAGENIVPQENAVIRVNVDEPPATIGVMQGSVVVSRDGGFSTSVRGGETLRGDSQDPMRFNLSENVPEQSWDRWNEDRDQAAANEANLQTDVRDGYAGNQGYGWSDLDSYGSWYDVPGEGRVWQPEGADASGFDPYGSGSWVYYPGPGYIWVSSYPWGWTPFRCGNWNYWNGFGWGWQPAGCNTWGWGFAGGGAYGGYNMAYLRIRRPPSGYRPPVRPPVQGPGRPGRPFPRPRPIIPVGTRPAPIRPIQSGGRPALFNGRTLQPLRPRGGYTQRGGGAVGLGLRKDFPVDSQHAPVMGIAPSQANTPVVVPGAGWRAVPNRGPQQPGGPANAGRPVTAPSSQPSAPQSNAVHVQDRNGVSTPPQQGAVPQRGHSGQNPAQNQGQPQQQNPWRRPDWNGNGRTPQGQTPQNGAVPVPGRPAPAQPAQQQQPAPLAPQQQSTPQQSRPNFERQGQRPGNVPAPQQSRPAYTPPPQQNRPSPPAPQQQRPNFAPAPQPSRPAFSPPPQRMAPPPMPRMAPPAMPAPRPAPAPVPAQHK